VEEGTYALELVLDWSVARITFVVLLPVLLSLAVGVWLNSRDWTDLATIQTAWGTASYVVTAGGCEFVFSPGNMLPAPFDFGVLKLTRLLTF
jgi:hypothetical protein